MQPPSRTSTPNCPHVQSFDLALWRVVIPRVRTPEYVASSLSSRSVQPCLETFLTSFIPSFLHSHHFLPRSTHAHVTSLPHLNCIAVRWVAYHCIALYNHSATPPIQQERVKFLRSYHGPDRACAQRDGEKILGGGNPCSLSQVISNGDM